MEWVQLVILSLTRMNCTIQNVFFVHVTHITNCLQTGEDGVPINGEQESTSEGDKAQADKQYIQAHILDMEQRLMQVWFSQISPTLPALSSANLNN